MKRWAGAALAVLSWAGAWAPWAAPIAAAEGQPPGQGAPGAGAGVGRVVVLSAEAPWRVHHTLAPPVIQLDSGPKSILVDRSWLDRQTPDPPAGWAQPDFADGAWLRSRLPTACRTPYLARQCSRSAFLVNDPGQVEGLRLSLAYRGGAVVYFNGQEIARGHLPAAAADGPALAEAYPSEAFVGASGALVGPDRAGRQPAGPDSRTRTLTDLAIPRELLRRGLNVLAVEVVRAPYDKVIEDKKGTGADGREATSRGTPYSLPWNTCELLDARLTADDGRGLIPSAVPPAGLRIWNGELLAWDSDSDFASPAEELRPVSIVGARGGSFSGKLLAGAPGPLRGLKATVSDLTADGGAAIPASAARVRYATAWDRVLRYGGRPQGIDILLESPPGEVIAGKAGRAVVPIWVTVDVPREAAPGTYRGRVRVQAEGSQAQEATVELKVIDWTLPRPQDYRTWVELIQSPDALAVEYDVPLWSQRHWQLIARSMGLLNRIGSRSLYLPLICHTNFGNEQSMVRWIRKGPDRFEHDFAVLEKYADLALEHMGQPKLVCLNAWEIYLRAPDKPPAEGRDEAGQWSARYALRGKGPAVTVLDPASGRTETVYLPRFEDPASKALWQPVFAHVLDGMKRRGLSDSLMLGMFWEIWPSEAEVRLFGELAPGLPWVNISHLAKAAELCGIGKIGYWTKAFGLEYTPDPSRGRTYGWKRPDLMAEYHRFGYWNAATPTTLRHDAEFNITGNQRGIGRIGGDYWYAMKDKAGNRVGPVLDRFPQSRWHNWEIGSWLLAPGPDGPVASARYENVREGIQECEARILIESALSDPSLRARLGEELARRCQQALDDRMRYLWTGVSTLQLSGRAMDYATYVPSRNMVFSPQGAGLAGQAWFLGTGWQGRTETLYQLAGQVTKALGAR